MLDVKVASAAEADDAVGSERVGAVAAAVGEACRGVDGDSDGGDGGGGDGGEGGGGGSGGGGGACEVIESQAGRVKIRIKSPRALALAFQAVEACRVDGLLENYAVTQSSLEDVFIKVCK